MERGRAHFSKEDIGGEILPILTTGLYHDTLDALREYIQNAIDAESSSIRLIIDPDTVTVIDDGIGMTGEQARRAIRLGISDKTPLQNVGFRGIGIYSAFNLCDTLEVFTKSARDEVTHRLYFDFRRVRHELELEHERRKQGQPPELYLERLLEEAVFVEPVGDGIGSGHGTQAVMSGLRPEAYLRLNSWTDVEEYLQNVVPLPFSPEFKYGPAIAEKFEERDYRVIPLTLRMGGRDEPVYRPYRDAVFKRGGQHPPAFFDVKSDGVTFGFAWVCVNDARETIKNTKVRGLLIKKLAWFRNVVTV